MKLDNALEKAFDGNAIMFAGAGYSYGANNLKGKPFMRGQELADYFAEKCNLPKGTSLDIVTEFYIEQFSIEELVKEIQSEFTARKIAPFHSELAQVPWKRIYTVNYDNVLELSWSDAGRKLMPITLGSNIYKIPRKRHICIHLNGYVDNLTADTILTELKLTESSYVMASIEKSEWITMFRQDINLYGSIFFLGYSLYDIDIKRILIEMPSLKEKCFFIVGDDPDIITKKRCKSFGECIEITVEDFSKRITTKKETYEAHDHSKDVFLSIREFVPVDRPTTLMDRDFINLLLFGDFKRELISESLRKDEKYLLSREKSDEIFRLIKEGHQINVVCSDLGNGKTLFLERVRHQALEKGFRVFDVLEHTLETELEFESLLNKSANILIIIEGYQDWLKLIDQFAINASKNHFLLLTARNAIHDVLLDELTAKSGQEFIPEINIDELTDQEIEWFIEAFNDYGLWGDYASNSNKHKFRFFSQICNRQIHAILLKLLESPDIQRRFSDLFKDIRDIKQLYEISITVFILTLIGHTVTIDTLVDMWGTEDISKLRMKKSSINQIVNFNRNDITAKSPIMAEYFLNKVADTGAIVNTMTKLAHRAHELSDNIKYDNIFRSLMRFSNIQHIMPDVGKKAAIMRYYESIKRLRRCNRYPLFWLQYAIASIVIGDLFRAKKYFKTAYSFAEKRDWDTFQIDNHYARFLLIDAVENIADIKEAMERFRRARNIVNRQMSNERLHYPYKVAILYQNFFDKFSNELRKDDVDLIKKTAQSILSRIQSLPEYRRKGRNIRECKLSMEYILSSQVGQPL